MADKKDSGWIKLERSVWDLPFWDEKPFNRIQAYIDLRLLVNHTDKRILVGNKIKIIKAGQHYTSISKLAKRWGWGRNRVKAYLEMLDRAGLCHTNVTPNGTTLTLINTGVTGFGRATNEATNESTLEATNEAAYEATNRPQTRMYKNDKRMITKNEKEEPPAQNHFFLTDDDGKVMVNSRGEPIEV